MHDVVMLAEDVQNVWLGRFLADAGKQLEVLELSEAGE